MRKRILLVLSLAVFLVAINSASAATFKVIRSEFVWRSSNLTEIQGCANQKITMSLADERFPLGNLAYDRYFERHATAPPLDFLKPLKRGSLSTARLDAKQITFHKPGVKIPLKTDITPSGADRADPYLLGVPDSNLVLVVHPYYFYGCKENDHRVELYSEHGLLLHTFDSLPTHALKTDPTLLISPEKSGCCDSLKWSIRFYNLQTGAVADFGCPEGFCGDVLFTRLGQDGPFIVGQEIIGSAQGVGATLQTNIFIVDTDGALLASAKMIHAVYNPSLGKQHMQDISPYSISKLVALKPADNNHTWYLQFSDDNSRIALKLQDISNDPTPAVVFLIPKNPAEKETIELNDQQLGIPPILFISEPGEFSLSQKSSTYGQRIHIQAEKINKIIF